jgi:hypothetical protein
MKKLLLKILFVAGWTLLALYLFHVIFVCDNPSKEFMTVGDFIRCFFVFMLAGPVLLQLAFVSRLSHSMCRIAIRCGIISMLFSLFLLAVVLLLGRHHLVLNVLYYSLLLVFFSCYGQLLYLVEIAFVQSVMEKFARHTARPLRPEFKQKVSGFKLAIYDDIFPFALRNVYHCHFLKEFSLKSRKLFFLVEPKGFVLIKITPMFEEKRTLLVDVDAVSEFFVLTDTNKCEQFSVNLYFPPMTSVESKEELSYFAGRINARGKLSIGNNFKHYLYEGDFSKIEDVRSHQNAAEISKENSVD